jgi:hypothetical protein
MTGTSHAADGRLLVTVAGGYVVAACVASVVAVAEDLPGRPLGIGLPIPVWAQVASGWGAGIAPPWPMPVLALVAAQRARSTGLASWAVTAGLVGVTNLAGHAVEPVTWHPRSWTRGSALAAGVMITAATALALTGESTARRFANVG